MLPGGQVTMALAIERDGLGIEVRDTGSGIAPEHLPHVFDRFYRADRARGGLAQNVGLGLTLVRGIARLHGGTVSIDTAPRRGTCVTVRLPRGGGPSPSATPSIAA